MTQIEGYDERKGLYKLSLILAIISTNYWSAYRALAFIALSLNAFVATILTIWPDTFLFKLPTDNANAPIIAWNWGTKFYYSIVTFTTLGYGDVTPLTWPAQLVAGIVAVSGYIILGTMIYLMSRKADNKF
jgi:voltage-gated potassium channel Kch